MKVIYFGHNVRGQEILKRLLQLPYYSDFRYNIEILKAIGLPHDNTNVWYRSIEGVANEYGIYYEEVTNPNNKEFIEKIKSHEPDLGIVCGYSKYISKELIDSFKFGIINLHASALPYYRGGAPLNWALINGEKTVGASIYWINEGIDTGKVINQKLISVEDEDDIYTLSLKVIDIYKEMIKNTLKHMLAHGKLFGKTQNLEEGSYYTRRRYEDGRIFFEDMTDVQVHNLVRALTVPWDCAYCLNKFGEEIKIIKTELLKRNFYGMPGRIASNKNETIVICKNRGIKILKAQGEWINCDNKKIFKVGEDLY